jgi:hypothetical protein
VEQDALVGMESRLPVPRLSSFGGGVTMCRRLIAVWTVLILGVATSGALLAAEPTLAPDRTKASEAGNPDLEGRLAAMEQRLQAIEEHLGLRMPPSRKEGDAFRGSTGTSRPPARIDSLEGQYQDLASRLAQIERQGANATRSDNPAPKLVPVPAVPIQGKVVLQNWTGNRQYVSVNGLRFWVEPGYTEVWVGYSPAEVYIPGVEQPKLFGMSMWRWNGREYEMRIDLRLTGLLVQVR